VRRNPLLRTEAGQRCAKVALDLAVPSPFAIDTFRARLEEVTGRDTQLHAVPIPAGAGSGIRLSGDGTDFFYYEERTSPFHQAHIVASLAARMLLAGSGPVIDARLTRGLEPQLVRHIFGEEALGLGSEEADSEVCAYLALEGLRPTVSRLAARRFLASLEPLHRALASAVPGVISGGGPGERATAGLRLYRVVTGILDLMLVLGLHPDQRPDGRTLAQEAARLAGMSRDIDQLILRLD
jgi:hypothetical protein